MRLIKYILRQSADMDGHRILNHCEGERSHYYVTDFAALHDWRGATWGAISCDGDLW